MPPTPQEQLDALKRSLCGDCGVGPFKGGERRNGARVSRRAAWLFTAGIVLAVTGVVAGVALLQ